MLYTTRQLIDYVDKLTAIEDELGNDVLSDFLHEGQSTLSRIDDVIRDYYFNELDEVFYPRNLDALCAFITAGALEMTPSYTEIPLNDMPDYHTIIKEKFFDDPFLHKTCDKYCSGNFDWFNIWINCYGDGSESYYALIKRFESNESPYVSMMKSFLGVTKDHRYLSLAEHSFSSSINESYNNTYYANTYDIDVCIMLLFMMLNGEYKYSSHIVNSSVFSHTFDKAFHTKSFDRIISNTLSANKIKSLDQNEKSYLQTLEETVPGIINSNTDDWLYAYRIASLLTESGKAAILIPNGSLVNKKDTAFRKLLLKNHKIEAIITLPTKKYYYSNTGYIANLVAEAKIPFSIVILSNDNDTVKTIDTQSLLDTNPEKYISPNFLMNGREVIDFKTFTEDICLAIKSNEDDTSFSKTLSEEDLVETSYALSFLRYSSKYDLIANGIAFGKVIKSVRRGTSQKGSIINTHESDSPSNYYFLMGSSISELITTIGLPEIEEPEEKLKKYCLRNGNIVITKNGVPKRAGIVEIEEYELILATDNCLIVDLDTKVINPYYVAAFLNSEKGRSSLERISVGTAVKTISVSDLKEMLIPCPSLQEQKEIAEKYEDYIKELHLLKIREAELQDSLANVFFGED